MARKTSETNHIQSEAFTARIPSSGRAPHSVGVPRQAARAARHRLAFGLSLPPDPTSKGRRAQAQVNAMQ